MNKVRLLEIQEKVEGYLGQPIEKRRSLSLFLQENKIRIDVYKRVIKLRRLGDEGQNPREWLDEHYQEMLQYTFESAKKGNAQSQKLFAQLAGKLVEKSEVKVGLTADDYNRIREEARRRASGDSGKLNGDRGLLTERAVLPDEVRPDTGRE